MRIQLIKLNVHFSSEAIEKNVLQCQKGNHRKNCSFIGGKKKTAFQCLEGKSEKTAGCFQWQ
ncbi:MAG: hypothetical protein ABIH28_03430 [archaeon]